jgi:hypothetical protein
MNQLFELSRKFPDSLVKQKPGSKFQASYVDHGTINARLLEVVGPFDFRIDRIITNSEGIAVGCTAELTVQVDGETVTVVEVGDVEHPSANSATNLKSASSDAFKRCCMRLGLGLHLWAGDSYFLDKSLEKRLNEEQETAKKLVDD